MTSKLKTDVLETVSGSGTIALTNQLSGMTHASVPSGSVLQVVSTNKTDAFTTTSATMTDITGLGLSITPSSTTSKILVTVNLCICSNHYTWHAGLWQDSTEIGIADAASNRSRHFLSGMNDTVVQNSHGHISFISKTILTSPNTTSPVVYQVKTSKRPDYSNTVFVNRSVPDRDNSTYDLRNISSITLTEIKG